ncbi:MAG: metallopeptidase family protein [Clostridiaceae bacterium]
MEDRMTPDRMLEILDMLADELPEVFFDRLNLGISVIDEVRYDPLSREGDPLFILGRYIKDFMGRRIEIYYGSFMRVFGYLNEEQMTIKLRETLRHEFRHHLENLGGERDLEWEDLDRLRDYLNKNK